LIYAISSEAAGLETLDAVACRRRVRRDDPTAELAVYHDTFDWRLYRDGGTLTASPGRRGTRFLWGSLDGSPRHRGEVDAMPAFAWDCPAGPCRDELAPIIEMRRLLPIVEVERRTRTVHVLDDQEKTVARLRLRVLQAAAPGEPKKALPAALVTVPLRGYEREHGDLVRLLESELGLVPTGQDELTAALAAIGGAPGDYSSKPRLDLEPSMRAVDAVVNIHRALLATLLANEDGTRRDLDSEFLHDFRVAVRRTRSALTQLEEVLPHESVERFREEFRWLGSVTGPTRDLDVYLLEIDGYEALLPEAIRGHLEPLREFLRRRQRAEQERLVGELGSPRYRELIAGWSAFLEGPIERAGAGAERPIRELASERILKAWRRVRKKGRAIDDGSPVEALHRLRIDAKKLRYLLEFFRDLYDAAAVEPLVRALKKLQDNLGDFNDLRVQQETLREFARRMYEEGAAPADVPLADVLLAMGELVAELRRLQGEERRRFGRRFAGFAAPENREAFRRLFGPP